MVVVRTIQKKKFHHFNWPITLHLFITNFDSAKLWHMALLLHRFFPLYLTPATYNICTPVKENTVMLKPENTKITENWIKKYRLKSRLCMYVTENYNMTIDVISLSVQKTQVRSYWVGDTFRDLQSTKKRYNGVILLTGLIFHVPADIYTEKRQKTNCQKKNPTPKQTRNNSFARRRYIFQWFSKISNNPRKKKMTMANML